MLTLFAQYYVPKEKSRQAEVDQCFAENIANPLVSKFVILFEREADMDRFPNSTKIVKTFYPERLTYAHWLQETDKLDPGTLSLLVNSDIYLTESIKHLIDHAANILKDKRFIALSRYNPTEAGLELNGNPHWTQDTWGLVKGKEPLPKAMLQETAFELGQPGCDNKIAYVMHSYGYKVSNPCEAVCTVHLQADAARSYDGKASKLIGLHAFVHPTRSVLDDAALEFDLLTRSPLDLVQVRVNNWINGRKSYELVAKSTPTQPAVYTLPESKKIVLPKPKKNIATSTEKIDCPEYVLAKDFKSEECTIFAKYSDRFVVYAKDNCLYFFDKYWPTVRKVARAALNPAYIKPSDPRLFAEGFLPAVLEVDTAKISDDMQYPEDILYWQFPCRTEGAAYEVHKGIAFRDFSKGIVNIYLPLPWATFIDKKRFPTAHLNLLVSRLVAAKAVLAKHQYQLKVHSVCQHIRWRNLQPWLPKLGITNLWISHKEIGLDCMDECTLHPWTLYAVNFQDKTRNKGLVFKPVSEKKTFASFIGAHMKHYPTDVRLRLNELKDLPNYVIEIKDLWHFNKVVYDYQVFGQEIEKDSIEVNEVERYNELISDSIFSLCPAGAGPNTLRLWESLAVGAIPVILSDRYEFPLACKDWLNAVIVHPEDDLKKLDSRLRELSISKIVAMQYECRSLFEQSLLKSCF